MNTTMTSSAPQRANHDGVRRKRCARRCACNPSLAYRARLRSDSRRGGRRAHEVRAGPEVASEPRKPHGLPIVWSAGENGTYRLAGGTSFHQRFMRSLATADAASTADAAPGSSSQSNTSGSVSSQFMPSGNCGARGVPKGLCGPGSQATPRRAASRTASECDFPPGDKATEMSH